MDVAADANEYLPASHRVHGDEPVTGLNWPGTHAVQLLRARPVYPSSHTQRLTALLPALEFELAGHDSQSSTELDPNAVTYVCTGHAVQLWSPGICLYVPIGHSLHTHTLDGGS